MPDSLTTALIVAGAVALGLWYVSRQTERHREIDHLVQKLPAVVASPDPDDERQAGLPQRLDAHWLQQRAVENLAVFQNTNGLFDRWLLGLRDRYSTPWELEIIENVEKKLRKQIDIMKLSAEHVGVRNSLSERAEAEVYRGQTDFLDAQVAHDEAEERGKHSNRLARARVQTEILELQAKAAGHRATVREESQKHRPPASPPKTIAERRREAERDAAAHATSLARERAQKAKHEADARSHRKSRNEPNTSAAEPLPPLTAAERRALLLRAEELKVQVIAKADTRARKELDELKQEYGADSEEYRDREAYWNHRLIALKEREPTEFLGQEDQERIRNA